jgi:cyd operon protein YbgT
MWYFSWILGLGFACSIGIMVGLWFELRAQKD